MFAFISPKRQVSRNLGLKIEMVVTSSTRRSKSRRRRRSRGLGTRAPLALATGVGRTNRLYDRSVDFGAIFERRGGIARPPHVDRSGHALPSLRCVSLTRPRPAPSPPHKRPTRRSGAVSGTFLKGKGLRITQTSSLGSGAVLGAFYNARG